jgi:GNAT superfamily N-acetyltransferase
VVHCVATWYDRVMPRPVLLRVRDDDQLRRWQSVAGASQAADFIGLPADPVEDSRPLLSGRSGDEDFALYVGAVDGVPVVSMLTRLPVHDNLTLANAAVQVHPDHRRRGYGRWAVEAVSELMRAEGRHKVLCEVPAATRTSVPSEGELFAVAVGARRMTVEKRRMLDVARVSDAQIATLLDEARAAASGYSVIAWRGRSPERSVAGMAALRALMSTDPPQGELELEPEPWDAARLVEVERSVFARGRQVLVVAARHDASGELVGYTNIGVPAGGGTVGYQWDTIVRADHRGHRLGLLVKLENLRELKAQLPEVRYLNTWNDDANSFMLAVNERLGYQVMEGWSEWQLDLQDVAGER